MFFDLIVADVIGWWKESMDLQTISLKAFPWNSLILSWSNIIRIFPHFATYNINRILFYVKAIKVSMNIYIVAKKTR